jgi:hypothetical protein
MPPSLTLVGHDPLGQFRHLAKVRGTEQPIPLTATCFSVRILGTLGYAASYLTSWQRPRSKQSCVFHSLRLAT